MKVILSRKGFDTESGKIPSPILPDGRMISLPVPDNEDVLGYVDLRYERNRYIVDLMKELGENNYVYKKRSRRFENGHMHLDPDLRKATLDREAGWKPLFGPSSRYVDRLAEAVRPGDLFLFFGWFRRTRKDGKNLIWDFKDKYNERKHLLFGYFQVEKWLDVNKDRLSDWMSYHPHAGKKGNPDFCPNILYVARDSLTFDSRFSGAGCFIYDGEKESRTKIKLTLTKPGESMSRWQLPFGNIEAYWGRKHPWQTGYFQSPGRGQELGFEENPLVENWARKLISKYAQKTE